MINNLRTGGCGCPSGFRPQALRVIVDRNSVDGDDDDVIGVSLGVSGSGVGKNDQSGDANRVGAQIFTCSL